jgi:hypothetical protein
MTTFLEISGLANYVAVVDQLIMTAVGPLAGTGIRFQVLLDGSPIPNVQYPANVELNKEAPTVYPAEPRSFYQPLLQTQKLTIQAENLGAIQRIILVGAYGWYYSTYDATAVGADNGVTDATYAPVTGGSAP